MVFHVGCKQAGFIAVLFLQQGYFFISFNLLTNGKLKPLLLTNHLKHMKKLFLPFAAACMAVLSITSCTKEAKTVAATNDVSEETLTKIYNLGFGKNSVEKHEDGYLVEGDIIITEEALNSTPLRQLIRFGTEEQYQTFNLVNAPRTITVSMSSRLPVSYEAGVIEAVNRYNALGLGLMFSYIGMDKDATIDLLKGSGSYLASAGFPSGGNPYGQVKVNSQAIGRNAGKDYLATILTHEIGHCIGFRHSDWMDRSISCGGSPSNEGQSTTGVGAVHIANTPTRPTRAEGSWMLACIGSGQNRPFNERDIYSLNQLYHK
jgi:hypothetical protein